MIKNYSKHVITVYINVKSNQWEKSINMKWEKTNKQKRRFN